MTEYYELAVSFEHLFKRCGHNTGLVFYKTYIAKLDVFLESGNFRNSKACIDTKK